MSRRRDDDSGEYGRPAPKGGGNAVLWIVLAVVGVVVLGCGGAVVAFVVVARDTAQQIKRAVEVEEARQAAKEAAKQNDPLRKVYTRDEFKRLVLGKTKDEVLKAVGKPDETSEHVSFTSWHYHQRTLDTVSGKTDPVALMTFDTEGKVDDVSF